MVSWEFWFALIPGVILFLYGIEHFSIEVQRTAGERFRSMISKATSSPWRAALAGAAVTAIVQSSTATTVITVGLVNSGVMSFAQSVGLIIGTNVGTTVTAQLVAFNLTFFAPIFILAGFIISLVGGRYRVVGRPVFYFGLVFFGLTLTSQSLEPLRGDPAMIALFAGLSNVFLGILAGFLATNVLQSSSVTTGITIVLAEKGLLTLDQSIPIILGANIGTTTTALIASWNMDAFARRTALAHVLFNFGGVILLLPFLGMFGSAVDALGGTTAHKVANAHAIFNLGAALVFLVFIEPFRKVVERIVPTDKQEVLFRTTYLNDRLPGDNRKAIRLIELEIDHLLDVTSELLSESASAMEEDGEGRLQRISKLESLNDFLNKRIDRAIRQLSRRRISQTEAEKTTILVRMSNAIENLGDEARKAGYLAQRKSETGARLSPEPLRELSEAYAKLGQNMDLIRVDALSIKEKTVERMRDNDVELREIINKSYARHIKRLTAESAEGSIFVEAYALIEAANANLRDVRKLAEMYAGLNGRKLGAPENRRK
jgi:phosphate:Na+ symporter